MLRPTGIALLLALASMSAALPLSHALLGASTDDTTVTLYLRGAAPVGNAETFGEYAASFGDVELGAPRLSPEAPTDVGSKQIAMTSLGNHDFRKNFFNAYWEGDVTGRVSAATATIYASSTGNTTLVAKLFGDGGIGSGGSFGTATAALSGGDPQLVTFDFGPSAGNVNENLVFAVGLQNGALAAGLVLYDSITHPSSLTFSLGEFVPDPPQVWTPAAGWSAPTLVNATHAHRETSIVISPVDPDLMVVCSPSGVPSTGYGQSFFHVSRDGGVTWDYLDVETGANDPRRFAFEGGDCDVAFDAAGTMYSADTWLGSLSVGHSRDGGRSWNGTALAASAPVVDRPWLVGGPEGVVHVTWQDVQFAMPSVIWYARSDDFGMTFTPATLVTMASADGAFTWTGNLVVSDDGQDLYSIYTRRQQPSVGSLDGNGPETVWVAASHNAGLTWTQHLVASMPTPASYLYPSLAMDAGGDLHAVFSSRTASDRPIWYARSTDDGMSWSSPIKILEGTAGWSPWVVGAGPGEAAVQWYGTLHPRGNLTGTFDWYFFTARLNDGAVTSAGPTTATPIFTGVQSAIPEFNQLRLDEDGKIHVGASAYYKNAGGSTTWAIFHQREA